MKAGFNLLLWTTRVADEHLPIIEDLKHTGYDGVEVPIHAGEPADYARLGARLRDAGLECTASSAIPDAAHSPISADPRHRQTAVDWFRWALDCAGSLGAQTLCGPLYAPLGVFSGSGPTEAEVQRALEVHAAIADHAADAGVTIALEALNRFECYFLNTIADAAGYVRRLGHPAVGIMYDTFHANIEEKRPTAAIAPAMDVLRHVHVAENDRGVPGTGHVDWAGTFDALRTGGYDGWLVIEAFGRSLPDLAAATCIWRDVSPSPEAVYRDGHGFLRAAWDAAA